MGRATATVHHAYGVDSDLSFGELLVKCLTFPQSEIAVDAERALAFGVEPATAGSVELARKQLVKQETALRLTEERRDRAVRKPTAA